MRGLDGKVALVTGAAGGIGRAIALRLAEEGVGVAATDLDESAVREVARVAKGMVMALRLDVTDEATIREAVAECERALGPLDVLVNNAGWDKVEPFVDSTVATWDRLIAINLKGPLLCTRVALDGMIARGRDAAAVRHCRGQPEARAGARARGADGAHRAAGGGRGGGRVPRLGRRGLRHGTDAVGERWADDGVSVNSKYRATFPLCPARGERSQWPRYGLRFARRKVASLRLTSSSVAPKHCVPSRRTS